MSQEQLKDQHLNAKEVADLDPYNQRSSTTSVSQNPIAEKSSETNQSTIELSGVRRIVQEKKDQEEKRMEKSRLAKEKRRLAKERKMELEKQRVEDAEFLKNSTALVLLKEAAQILSEGFKGINLSITDPKHDSSYVRFEDRDPISARLAWDIKLKDGYNRHFNWKEVMCTLQRTNEGAKQFLFERTKIDPIPAESSREVISQAIDEAISHPQNGSGVNFNTDKRTVVFKK